jgi:hypothetical protein
MSQSGGNFKILNSTLSITKPAISKPSVKVILCILRFQFYCLVVILNRLLVIAKLGISMPSAGVSQSHCILRIQFNSLAVILNRLLVVVKLAISDPSMGVST